jgi:hypothetical protein
MPPPFKLSPSILTALIAGMPVDSLNEPEASLLRRAADAMRAVGQYASYVEQTRETTSTVTKMNMPGLSVVSKEQITVDKTSYVLQDGPDKNIRSQIAVEIKGVAGTAYALTLSAEVRLVDGGLYVLAERTTQGNMPPLPDMPTGWARVDPPEDWPALERLDLDSFFEDLFPARPDLAPFAFVPTVSAEPGASGNSAPVDLISVSLGGEALNEVMQKLLSARQDSGPLGQALFAQLDASSTMQITAALNQRDRLARCDSSAQFAWIDLDMSLINPDMPVETLLNMTSGFTGSTRINAVNGPLTPVEVPVSL